MHKAKYLIFALVFAAAATATTLPRPASAMAYSTCMSSMLRYGFSHHWLDIGPGILIEAALDVCGRYMQRA